MPTYNVITETLRTLPESLNNLSKEGWRPILMSTTPTSPNSQTDIAVTVILENPTSDQP
jgi:hypothetical protein